MIQMNEKNRNRLREQWRAFLHPVAQEKREALKQRWDALP